MGVQTLEVGYTSATTGRGDHEVRTGHVVALEKKLNCDIRSDLKLGPRAEASRAVSNVQDLITSF
jgi:hypothetical protein